MPPFLQKYCILIAYYIQRAAKTKDEKSYLWQNKSLLVGNWKINVPWYHNRVPTPSDKDIQRYFIILKYTHFKEPYIYISTSDVILSKTPLPNSLATPIRW